MKFFNTAVIPSIIYFRTDDWFSDTGLISDFWFITFSISFLDPLIHLINFKGLLKMVKKKYYKRQK